MNKIHMVDVVTEYKKHSVKINEIIEDTLSSGSYIQGERVKSFEKMLSDFLDVKHVISCGNGTDALQVALMALGLKMGDEVLVPSFTFVATVETVCLLGYKPVFVDIDPNSFLLDIKSITKSITKKTKAIIPVHLFGQCCNMGEIKFLAEKFNLFVIEDAAQSIGSKCKQETNKWTYSGTIGDIGTTSFYPSKNLGCIGDGGAIFTNNSDLAKKIRLIVNHGQEERYKYKIIGLNSRLDALQAAILSFKLTLLEDFIIKRKKIADLYNKAFSTLSWLTVPVTQNYSDHVYHQYSLLLSTHICRASFQNYLHEHGIPTMVYYPIPLHKQEAYHQYCTIPLPNSEKTSNCIISIPMHPHLDSKQIDFICNTIKSYNQ
ncbi:MAG: transcriptional regulator [Flavobacteriales bacterium]|nr:transcriptional regulator [Flavobacteriales bacterium]|tara:strand:- start:2869 stop:3993 length:1125 start_codon:yes stop_codon:yes gene_type:complete